MKRCPRYDGRAAMCVCVLGSVDDQRLGAPPLVLSPVVFIDSDTFNKVGGHLASFRHVLNALRAF